MKFLMLNRSRMKWAVLRVALAGAIACGLVAGAEAKSAIYTLRAMADGSFQGVAFHNLPITIRMKASTETIKAERGANGGTVYTNRKGTTKLSIPGFPSATFVDGEVYVRYDTGNGTVGFGSSIGPTYPIAIGCADFATTPYTADCMQGDFTPGNSNTYNGVATALADPANAVYQSLTQQTLDLPTTLRQGTLLTGIVHECATVYTSDSQGNLYECAGDAPRGLKTDKGQLFLRQAWSLSHDRWPSTNVGTVISYMGYLHVEVFEKDD